MKRLLSSYGGTVSRLGGTVRCGTLPTRWACLSVVSGAWRSIAGGSLGSVRGVTSMSDLADRIRTIADAEPGLMRREIAERVGCSRAYVCRVLGPITPTSDTRRILAVLSESPQMSVADIVQRTGVSESSVRAAISNAGWVINLARISPDNAAWLRAEAERIGAHPGDVLNAVLKDARLDES